MPKKILPLFVLAISILLLTGCGNVQNRADVIVCQDEQGSYYATSSDGKTFLFYYPGNAAESFTVPDGIEIVAEDAFAYIPNLKELSFASSVQFIHTGAFSANFDTIKLEKLTIPASVQNYKNSRFEFHGPYLKELIIECEIGDSLHLADCKSLNKLTLATVPKELNWYSFYCNMNLTSIVVIGQESIRDEAFEAYCASKNDYPVLYIPDGVEVLENELIYSCVNLYVPDSVKTVSEWLYYKIDGDVIVSISPNTEISGSGVLQRVAETVVR